MPTIVFKHTRVLGLIAWLALSLNAQPQPVPSWDRFANVMEYDRPCWTPDGRAILFQSGPPRQHRLYRIAATGGEPTLVFPELHRGQPAVHPSGRLAFTALDGEGRPHIWTANLDGSSVQPLTAALPGAQSSAAWSPDGSQLAYAAFNGPMPAVYIISAAGGTPKRVADGGGPVWANDGKSIAYVSVSPLSGSQAISVKPMDGAPRRLNSTVMPVVDNRLTSFDWSPDGTRMLVSRLDQGRWCIDLIDVENDKVISRLPLPGSVRTPRWSPDAKRIAYILADSGHPAAIHIVGADGSGDFALTTSEEFVTARLVKYKSADGTEIPAFLYQPAGPAARRAAIVWLHGGLGGLTLDEYDPSIQYFVANGFVVLAPNYRSSSGFGPAIRNLKSGDQIVDDVEASVDFVRSAVGVDARRIFAFGVSFGGWAVLRTVTAKPGLFAAAAEQCGISDLRLLYETSPAMRSFAVANLGGSPEESPDRYRAESPVNAVDRLTTPLLILHGERDSTVPFSQATSLVAALKQAGKSYEFVTYPGEDHGFKPEAWRDSVQQILRYFEKSATGAALLDSRLNSDAARK